MNERTFTSRWGRRATVLLVLVVGCVGVGFVAFGSQDPTVSKRTTSGNRVEAGPVTTTAGPSEPIGNPTGAPSTSDTSPPASPPPPAPPGVLTLSTEQIDLATNEYQGSFTIRNVGGSPFTWGWQRSAHFSASPDGGTLAPGEAVAVMFVIDPTEFGAGQFFSHTIVYSTGGTVKLLVTGKKVIVVNPDIPLPKPQIKPNN